MLRIPETKKIRVYNSPHEVRPARLVRLARVEFSNGTIAYIGWHDLMVLRRQFLNTFKKREDLPGMKSVSKGQVRAVFSWETFYDESSGDEELWMAKRLPDRLTLEPTAAEPDLPMLQ